MAESETGRATRANRYSKSESTEKAIMDAAVDCLVEQGYRGVSLQKVAQRAGVTRGCVQYYAASTDALLERALEYIVDHLWGDFLRRSMALQDSPGRLKSSLDMVLSLPDSRYFLAWNELLGGCRTAPQLQPVVERGAALLEQVHDKLFREFHGEVEPELRARFRAMDDLFVMVLHALPLVKLAGDDAGRKERVKALLQSFALQVFSGETQSLT